MSVGGALFTLKDVSYFPEFPRANEAFGVTGRAELFGIPFLPPLWVIVTCTYPETWWEEIVPIIGAPSERRMGLVRMGNFRVDFPLGLKREGEYELLVELFAGPTTPLDSFDIPPIPSVSHFRTKFTISGKVVAEWSKVDEVINLFIYPGVPAWEIVDEKTDLVIRVGDVKAPEWVMHQQVPSYGGLMIYLATPGWSFVDQVTGLMLYVAEEEEAKEEALEYQLEVSVEPPGTGYVIKSPDHVSYPAKSSVYVAAVPNTGYEFDHWGGDVSGVVSPVSVYMDGDKWVVAAFRTIPVEGFTLTVRRFPRVGFELVGEPDKPVYSKYELVHLRALPPLGYEFDHWDINGNIRYYNPASVIMVQDTVAVAYYKEVEVTTEGGPTEPSPEDWEGWVWVDGERVYIPTEEYPEPPTEFPGWPEGESPFP